MENKTLTITKIILLVIIVLLLSTILVVLLVKPRGESDFLKFSTKSELVYNKEIEEPVKKIAITTKSADIRLEKSNSDKLVVKYYGDKDDEDLTVTTNNEILNINEEASSVCIGICNSDEQKVVISIPENIDYELDFETASGDVYVPATQLSKISLKTDSGDIDVATAENANLETTSGEIEINEVGHLSANTVSGEISANHIKKSCNMKTTSGDVDIKVLDITENSEIATVSGDVEIETNRGSYIKTETVSGEVSTANNNRYDKTELTIKTTSGDIEVEN